MTMYQAGQRVLVKQLHHQHSIDKSQEKIKLDRNW